MIVAHAVDILSYRGPRAPSARVHEWKVGTTPPKNRCGVATSASILGLVRAVWITTPYEFRVVLL